MYTNGDQDYLDEDPLIPSQQWALVSIISPATVNTSPDFKWDMRLLKVRYVCETEEQADAKAAYFHKIDEYHHIIKIRIGRWCPFDDRDECAEEIDYGEERMNTMMKAFKEQQKKADEHENERRANAKRNLEKTQKTLEARRRKRLNKKNKNVQTFSVDLEVNQDSNKLKSNTKLESVEEISMKELLDSNIIEQPTNLANKDEVLTNLANKDEVLTNLTNKAEIQESTLNKINAEYAKVQEQLAKLKLNKT